MKRILTALRNLKVPVLSTSPANEMVDAEIKLGGDYVGIHIQVGRGYYSVVREVSDGCMFFDGNGDLQNELNEAKL